MMRVGSKLLFAAVLSVFSLAIRAEPGSVDRVRIPTVTRLVQVFSQLEAEIIAALRQKDHAKLAQLMDQNFELQVALKSADSVPFSQWLNASMAEAATYSDDLADMAVRDLGHTAIVSFVWKPYASPKKKTPSEIFIVDVWKKDGAEWKLALRFASATRKQEVKFPGFAFTDGVLEKRY